MNNETIESFEEEGILNIEKVINGYNAYIYKILQNSISNELDIEEILSDVFVIFWKKYKELDKRTKVKPYLAGITKNLIKKKYANYSINVENIDDYENEMVYNIATEELVENKEKSKIISKTLANIKEIDKDIFIMFYYKQKKIKDIARIFKISETKVKVILHRVRKSIKKNLKERGYNYGK
ncbi:MAG: sigma-70 family RNA polymerase sigma factor [Clostridia bacterium]|nr:sigma-70 family RNA polymerase sigma factor [Clostridia bacterium]